jgi:hypothetical protein
LQQPTIAYCDWVGGFEGPLRKVWPGIEIKMDNWNVQDRFQKAIPDAHNLKSQVSCLPACFPAWNHKDEMCAQRSSCTTWRIA